MKLTITLLAISTWAAIGCVTPYRAPLPSEPHATVKVRRVHEETAGTSLHESCTIDGHVALSSRVGSAEANVPRIDAILVHPRPAYLQVETGFSHVENRSVQESYSVQVPYQAQESYDCSTGYGTSRSYRTCSRSVTRYRSETKYRTVTKAVDISDGSCQAAVWFAPADGRMYLIQYDYRANGVCSASCFEQVPGEQEGVFQNAPCQRPTKQ